MAARTHLLFIFLFCGAIAFSVPNSSAALTVLTPADDHRTQASETWLIVDSPSPIKATIDGKTIEPSSQEENTIHYWLTELKPEGSKIEISDGEETVSISIYGESVEADPFHPKSPDECWSCHDTDETACGDCHKWPQSKHKGALENSCGLCHKTETEHRAEGVVAACESCHPNFAGGKHPHLRHAVTAPNDPLRPGRQLDCTSCHNPHKPICLGCMEKNEQRKWCLRCHSNN